MAIKANTREIVNLGESIKKISGISSVVTDTLLGLAENLEGRIKIDATTFKFFENIEKGLDIDKQLRELVKKISDDDNKIKRPDNLPDPNDVGARDFNISSGDISNLANTLTSLERAEQNKLALNNAVEDNNATIRNNKGKDNLQVKARNTASNNKQILNYDIRETNRIIPLLRDLKEIQDFKKNYGTLIKNRKTEFKDIKNLSKKFNTSGDFQSKNRELNPAKDLNNFKYSDSILTPLPLKTIFFGDNTPENDSYAICDIDNGKPLDYNDGYNVRVGGKDIKVKGIKIENKTFKINDLCIDPIDDINFSVTIKISVRGSQQKSGVSVDAFKNITINLQSPKISQADRQRNYDTYNDANTIDNRIKSVYENRHKEREDGFIRDLLRTNGNEEEVNKIYENEILRKELIKQVRNHPGVTFPMTDIGNLQTEFKNKITDDNESSKVPLKYLVSDNAFIDYLRNNIAKNVEDFLKKKVKKDVDGDIDLRNNILTTFTDFQTDMEKILGDDPSIRTNVESTINLAKSNKRKRKNNYMKFMIGKSENLKDQTLKLNDKDHKYSVDLSCETMNKLVANIEVDGQKISLAGRNLQELMKSIVNSGRIESNKLAVHVAFGVMKTMIKMMKSNNMNIDIRNGAGNLVETRFDKDKLMINEVDNTGRTVCKIFDEDHFKNLKDFNTLDIALGQLTKDFHGIMHNYNQDYKKATQYTIISSLMKYDPRGTRGFRWLRKAWNWKKKNTLDFEFPSTSVSVGEKKTNISLERGLFTISFLEKEFTSKDLGRIFKKNKELDGMQMEIIAAVNSKYVEMLRNNARVRDSNFGVYDEKLKRIYILDSGGKLNYIEKSMSGGNAKKMYGRIKDKSIPDSMIPITDKSEVHQFWQNPVLGGKIIKSMQRRLGGF